MNRGSDPEHVWQPKGSTCFNEAPIHESGKSRRSSPLAPAAMGFNEAPIHESGKWRGPRGSPRALPSFNEAPIHESGKWERYSPSTDSTRWLQ